MSSALCFPRLHSCSYTTSWTASFPFPGGPIRVSSGVCDSKIPATHERSPSSLRPSSPARTAPAVTHDSLLWRAQARGAGGVPYPRARAQARVPPSSLPASPPSSDPSGTPRAPGFPSPPRRAASRSRAVGATRATPGARSARGEPEEDWAVLCARVGGVAESPETARPLAASHSPWSSAPGLVIQAREPASHRGGLATAS